VVTTGPAVGVFCGDLARVISTLGMLGKFGMTCAFYVLLVWGMMFFYSFKGMALALAQVGVISRGIRGSLR
jgi:hypothetical protein